METNRAINFDHSYQGATMQDFIINQAKMHQQHVATVKGDSPTKQFKKKSFFTLSDIQACSATRDLHLEMNTSRRKLRKSRKCYRDKLVHI